MKNLLLSCLVTLLALAACSTRLQVTSYPTQQEQQLSKLTTYCWASPQGEANALEKQDPLGGHHNAFDSLIRATAEADLKAKGFEQTDCTAANFELDYRLGSHNDIAVADASTSNSPASNTSQPNPYGPRWSIGDDHSVSYEGLKKPKDNVIVVRHGTLHFAAFTSQDLMLWHSSAEKPLNDQDDESTRQANIVQAVHELLMGFPAHSRQ